VDNFHGNLKCSVPLINILIYANGRPTIFVYRYMSSYIISFHFRSALFAGNKGFDHVREIIIPAVVVMTITTLAYLGIKFSCTW